MHRVAFTDDGEKWYYSNNEDVTIRRIFKLGYAPEEWGMDIITGVQYYMPRLIVIHNEGLYFNYKDDIYIVGTVVTRCVLYIGYLDEDTHDFVNKCPIADSQTDKINKILCGNFNEESLKWLYENLVLSVEKIINVIDDITNGLFPINIKSAKLN